MLHKIIKPSASFRLPVIVLYLMPQSVVSSCYCPVSQATICGVFLLLSCISCHNLWRLPVIVLFLMLQSVAFSCYCPECHATICGVFLLLSCVSCYNLWRFPVIVLNVMLQSVASSCYCPVSHATICGANYLCQHPILLSPDYVFLVLLIGKSPDDIFLAFTRTTKKENLNKAP